MYLHSLPDELAAETFSLGVNCAPIVPVLLDGLAVDQAGGFDRW